MKKILIFFLIVTSFNIFAANSVDEISIQYYKNIRGMGMGNTYVTSASDESVLLYNPAMLNYIDRYKFSLFGLAVGMNDEGKDVIGTMIDVSNDISDGSFEDNDWNNDGKVDDSDQFKYLKDKQSEINNLSLNGYFGDFTGLINKNFGIGLFAYSNINKLAIVNPVNPTVIANMSLNVEAPIGIATKIGPFSFGASIRYLNYINFDSKLTSNKLISAQNVNDSKAMFSLLGATKNEGFGLDFGGLIGNDKFKLGFALQDAYTKVDTWRDSEEVNINGHPTNSGNYVTYYIGEHTVTPNLRAGISIKPSKWLQLSGEVENLLNKDMNNDGEDDTNIYKKLHLGSEISMFPHSINLKLRAGINQGYGTYGFYVQPLRFMERAPLFLKVVLLPLWILNDVEFEYADFTEELSPHVGVKPNHMQALSFTLRF
ncbi:hypothetical protein [Haliovirga abyssi]|uniref:DUF5723 domain-containing protein n=1 Tax=Haliovirga abyssi TaxID=2996794 RepID=A0AAU9DWW9_9FUSO|nr:hypothetical protein [Haliovirga abyssi]BDU49790.1 hypothetical protein HLVA_03590 [Haliovirga abyssi]